MIETNRYIRIVLHMESHTNFLLKNLKNYQKILRNIFGIKTYKECLGNLLIIQSYIQEMKTDLENEGLL